jgi:sugar transferase EpsL
MSYRSWKRAIDITGAFVGLTVAAVPMALIAALIRLRMGSPMLHEAPRPGLHGKPFVLYKFRTMAQAFDAAGKPLPDKDRVTPLGRFLRRNSLDELPQLFNVLVGDMSLVGPRPLKMEYLALYTPHEARRHEVRPGITGLAQVMGRNRLPWDQRFALDVEYVDELSLWLDVRILLRTVFKLVRRDSVGQDGDVDVPTFTGSANATPETTLTNFR